MDMQKMQARTELERMVYNQRDGVMSNVVKTLELLLRKTEENGHTIALIFPDETKDFILGYTAGQTDAFRLALDHIKNIGERGKHDRKEDGA